jgi:hypothetical protein
MDQPTEPMAPAAAPHSHKTWNILLVLFLLLFIFSAVINVFLFMSWSNATELVDVDGEEISDVHISVTRCLESGGSIPEDGIGPCDCSAVGELDSDSVSCVTISSNEVMRGSYDDDFISFEYPEDVYVSFAPGLDGRDSRKLEFWVIADDGTLNSTGLRFYYPTELDSSDGGLTVEEVKAHYEAIEYVETEVYIIDGRESVKAVTGDLSGDTFTLYIPSSDIASVDTYQFKGAFLNDEVVDRIIDQFVETAELKI